MVHVVRISADMSDAKQARWLSEVLVGRIEDIPLPSLSLSFYC